MATAQIKLAKDIAHTYSNLTKGRRVFTAVLEQHGEKLEGATVKFETSSMYFAYGAGEFELA